MRNSAFNTLKQQLTIPLIAAGAFMIMPVASQAAAEVAAMTSHGSAISWHPSGAYESATLRTTNPDGSISEQSFSGHEQISITAPGSDGSYTYELVLSPMIPPGLRAQMEEHRANHPGEKFMGGIQGGSQSGAFSVNAGSIVDSTLPE